MILEDVKTVDDGASSSTAPGSTYEVFLSFRGLDTRLNFTDHLYNYLIGVGVRTFRDKEELHVGKGIGPDLIKAIEESSISIPIFSKGYASSKWCLRELTHMVKCMKDEDPQGRPRHTVCPIFYDVTPDVVKHQKKSFAKAFAKHTEDKEVDACTVQEWKDALKEVCELKGWEKDKIADGHEAELIKDIVTEVCKKLKKAHVSLTDDLVGMDHHRNEMSKLLNNGGNGVRIVGIVGLGGIGKTTIAKFMYNKLCDQFQPQCGFLEDVRERVKRNGCAELRKQLISDVLKCSADKTALNITNAFIRKKVLIVLDDVEKRAQLTEIIGGLAYFGSGSRIIVTTRNKDVFIESEGDLIYEPSGMDSHDSLLLFCKYAFKSTPDEEYKEISREVVQTAAGLPLSLVVIGSMLRSKERKYWEATLKKLKTIPAHEVQERLKISYDALTHDQKQMFLDIACHFIEQDKTYVMYMWDACGFFPESFEGIDVLVSRSLITIEKLDNLRKWGRWVWSCKETREWDKYVFRMHDHLRDLGRDIVKQENQSHPGKRSRLWSCEEAREVLDKQSGTEKVETFSMNYVRDSDYIISNDDLKGLSSLRYLCLEGVRLKGDFKGLVSDLRWFRWKFYDSNDALLNFGCCGSGLGKLVILDLSESDIRDGWESWIQIKAATNLKVLNLSWCRHLTKLPECLWNMESLVELDLSSTKITKLPEQGIGNLTNLTKLLLSRSRIKRLPDAIGKLEKLEVLNCCCRSLEVAIPKGIERLSSLRVLNLFNPLMKVNLTRVRIPLTAGSLNGVRGLVNLRDLEFYENVKYSCEPVEEEVVGVVMPSSLEKLTLRGFDDHVMSCRLIQAMKFDSSSRLMYLSIINCTFGTCSLDLSNCRILTELSIDGCREMRDNADFGSLFGSTWERITMTKCGSLEVLLLRGLSNLKRLKMLHIFECPKLREINGLEALTSMKELRVEECPLWMQTYLSNCQVVEELAIIRRNNINLAGLDDHVRISFCLLPTMKFDSSSRLNRVEISSCTFRTLPMGLLNLSNFQTLKELSISQCDEMRKIKGLEVLTSLEKLTVHDCPLLMLLDLSNCQMLTELLIFNCPAMREIKGLEVLTSLKELNVQKCPDLMLLDLSNCQMLTELSIFNCPAMREIKGLEVLTSLKELNVQKCPDLMLLDLSNCQMLTELSISNYLSCPLLMLLDLSNFQMLKHLSISDCPTMREIKGLAVLTSLEKLTVLHCPLLMLLDLSNCQMLKRLTIKNCRVMREIKGFAVLISLVRLTVIDCPLLKNEELLRDLSNLKGLNDNIWWH